MSEPMPETKKTVWTKELTPPEGMFVRWENDVRRYFRLIDIVRVAADNEKYGDADGMQYQIGLVDLPTGQNKVWSTTSVRALNALKKAGVDAGKEFSIMRVGEGFGTNYEVRLEQYVPSPEQEVQKENDAADRDRVPYDQNIPVDQIPF